MSAAFPARLQVLLAREAATAVVIRRGPSKSVCTIGWNRDTDAFTVGQWLRGRIYEERCDLSPDGRHFIYFALNGRWQSEARGAYTAVSRAPFLKAIMLLPVGHTWGGGGLFTSNSTYWMYGADASDTLRNTSELTPVKDYPGCEGVDISRSPVYYTRIHRSGWQPVPGNSGTIINQVDVFEKRVTQDWILRKHIYVTGDREPGRGCMYEEHSLIHIPTGKIDHHSGWEWAELDRHRLVWAEAGCMYAAQVNKRTIGNAEILHDFNGMNFQRIKAPY